jgi:hypothetical protein
MLPVICREPLNPLREEVHYESPLRHSLLSGISPGKLKKSTAKNYEILLAIFKREYGDREIDSITSDEVMGFLNRLAEGTKQATKKFRYALLKAFFNFIKHTIDETLANPCDTLILRKILREPKIHRWDILEKDLVDEMIFRTRNRRNRSRSSAR